MKKVILSLTILELIGIGLAQAGENSCDCINKLSACPQEVLTFGKDTKALSFDKQSDHLLLGKSSENLEISKKTEQLKLGNESKALSFKRKDDFLTLDAGTVLLTFNRDRKDLRRYSVNNDLSFGKIPII